MYLIEEGTELTGQKILSLLQDFNTAVRPKLQKYHDYYMGKQKIAQKPEPEGVNKPCNRITTNYCKNIVDNYAGYLTGKDITYNSEQDISAIQDILNYNDVSEQDSQLLLNALIYGVAYEVNFIDEDGKQRFAELDSREVFPIYYNTLTRELAAVVRYYVVDTTDVSKGYFVEVYTNATKMIYKTNFEFSSFTSTGQGSNNYYNQIPISVFELNKEQVSIFDCIMELQDAYNTLQSSEVDDFEAFCDAYLVLKGMQVDEDTAATIRQHRILDVGENGEAHYLTKNVSDTQIANMLQNINDNIHKISCSPDFTEESFGTSSGIALRYRLLAFENRSSSIEKAMTKTLQKRIELICSILSKVYGEEMWRDIQIVFTRNLPIDIADVANTINGFRGLVSDKTLLSQVPFVQDIDQEMQQVEEQQKKNRELYSFGNVLDSEDN